MAILKFWHSVEKKLILTQGSKNEDLFCYCFIQSPKSQQLTLKIFTMKAINSCLRNLLRYLPSSDKCLPFKISNEESLLQIKLEF